MIENIINYIKDDEFLLSVFNKYVHVFNYIKILDVYVDRVSILVKGKKIDIKGEKLLIKKLDKAEILISGIIKRVDLIDK